MIIAVASVTDRIRLIAIEMEGAFGNEGALRFCSAERPQPRVIPRLAQRAEGPPKRSIAFAKLFGDCVRSATHLCLVE